MAKKKNKNNSDTIRTAWKIFAGVWAFIFLFFILLTMALNWLQHLFVPGGMPVISMLLVQAVVALIYSAVMYVISAIVMDRYLSV